MRTNKHDPRSSPYYQIHDDQKGDDSESGQGQSSEKWSPGVRGCDSITEGLVGDIRRHGLLAIKI